MSEKKFSKFFIANLKRTAQNVSPMIRRKQQLQKEVAEALAEIEGLEKSIKALDGYIREETGGFGVEDLIERKVIDTGKVDKNGNAVKQTKWDLRYPETIVPPCADENNSIGEMPAKELDNGVEEPGNDYEVPFAEQENLI